MIAKSQSFKAASRCAAIAALGLSLSACAIVSQNQDGSASVVGLAAVSMQQTPGAPPGHVTVRSHGITLSDRPPAQGLVVGVYDQQMQFGQPAPATYYPAGRGGNIDFVQRTRMERGGYEVEERHVVKRVKYRKKRKCRCR